MRHLLTSTLVLSSVLFPAVAFASSSTDDATAPAPVRISTGVTAPVLAKNINIQIPDGVSKSFLSPEAAVELSLTVDANGQPQNVKVVKPANPYWDARVVDAVQKSHFRPGTVSNTPIPVEMDLTVTVAH
jgi:TonB family protein